VIKNNIKRYLIEFHNIQKTKNIHQNVMAAVQSLIDASRYLESASEDITDKNLLKKIINIKKTILTDNGMGSGFDDQKNSDIVTILQKISTGLETSIEDLHNKHNISHF
jgi:hypothetical protein